MRGNVSMVRMSKPPGVTLLDHRRPAPVRTYPDTRRRAVTRLTALFRRQTGLYRARARTAAASKQRSPLIKPSTNDYYLRTPDGSNRRIADVADRGLGRFSWAEGCGANVLRSSQAGAGKLRWNTQREPHSKSWEPCCPWRPVYR